MFGTSIQELFGSISVGILTSFFSIYLMHYIIKTIKCAACDQEKIFDSHKTKIQQLNSSNTTLALILFVFVYALGQLMEDVTDNLTDSSVPKIPLPELGQKIIGAERTFRYDVIIKELKQDDLFLIELTSLGKYVFNHKKVVRQILNNNGIDLKILDKINQNNAIINQHQKEQIKKSISAIYYKSKNWCYTNNRNNFRELELIQNRINFSRSTLLISFLFILLLVFLTLYQILRIFVSKHEIKFIQAKKKKYDTTILNCEIENLKWLWKRNIIPIIFLLILFSLSKIGYEITEQNFNERVLGYYFSNIDQILIEKLLDK